MINFPYEIFNSTISDAEPCGPSLELLGDVDYMQFLARLEGILPESFFTFDHSLVNFKNEIDTLKKLLNRSTDLQLLVALAKLSILDRDLLSFSKALSTILNCISKYWDHVHPHPVNSDTTMRVIYLQALDDIPNTVMPLQSVPLFSTRRFGEVTFRSYLLSEGKTQDTALIKESRGNDKPLAKLDVRAVVADSKIEEIIHSRELLSNIVETLSKIEDLFERRSSSDASLNLIKLKNMSNDVLQFCQDCIAIKDPSKVIENKDKTSKTNAEIKNQNIESDIKFENLNDVRFAIKAASNYFSYQEPSSPVRLILAQVDALIGKSFYEVLKFLTPDYVGQASVKFGGVLPLSLPVESLSNLLVSDSKDLDTEHGTNIKNLEQKFPNLKTRDEAIDMLRQISKFYRMKEPSSPIPVLLDHACTSVGRDFVALLRDILPSRALSIDE